MAKVAAMKRALGSTNKMKTYRPGYASGYDSPARGVTYADTQNGGMPTKAAVKPKTTMMGKQ